MTPAISLHGAVALAGRFPVLTGVDLTVERGETVLLRGANGAGKTSLLRLLAGLLPLADGTGEVLGNDLRRQRSEIKRKVGFVGHETGLYDDLSVAENLRFWVRAAGGSQENVPSAAERFGLNERLMSSPVHRLSMGQRRRVALTILLAQSAPLWLLDEPHAGLDADGRRNLDAVMSDHVGEGGTILFASHETDPIRSVASRVIEIAGGRVHEAAQIISVALEEALGVG